jgi:hypothetical protein
MYSVAQTSDGYIWIVHWNIRELQNLRERAALLSNGPSLRVPLAEILTDLGLGATAGLIGCPRCSWHGARLGLKRTSPGCKIQRLGISRLQQ